ncbi:phytanoyl-CoA dioxygenase family protein [Piedraia hortae CBS 480.64]|uniref:Phytanoyl-CoA dioxygenase family protein n=1 Tax=Piedraia hortae CBS 480.64 TaxID=1314780 RepID=A0A6A7C312_9PEZI|nr:phytanoyl-CoA dioxygenase family protein [Piedraia hortae CBS 480.64]
MISAEELCAALARDGFVQITRAFTDDEVEKLRVAAARATRRGRDGQWKYVRTVPRQFPPWPVEDISDKGIWGVQHLLHPSMPAEDRKVFGESYFNKKIIAFVTTLLQCTQNDLIMELYNMLVTPPTSFSLRWHRDDIPPGASPEEEMERLARSMTHAQWNLALYPDSSLVVVPGSHKRPRTPAERDADPHAVDLPGASTILMDPGDIVLYNNNILHRGVYDSSVQRMTLHGSMGTTSHDDRARARNILQHGIGDWAAECDFGDLGEMACLAKEMQRRLVDMGSGRDVGFSQPD